MRSPTCAAGISSPPSSRASCSTTRSCSARCPPATRPASTRLTHPAPTRCCASKRPSTAWRRRGGAGSGPLADHLPLPHSRGLRRHRVRLVRVHQARDRRYAERPARRDLDHRLISRRPVHHLIARQRALDLPLLHQAADGRLEGRGRGKDEGPIADLLNIEITQSKDGKVKLSQTNYIEKLVATHFPTGVELPSHQAVKTPCDESLVTHVADALSSTDEVDDESRRRYQSLVGALL